MHNNQQETDCPSTSSFPATTDDTVNIENLIHSSVNINVNYNYGHNVTKLFLCLIKENEEKFVNPRIRKSHLWKDIASRLSHKNYSVTERQCESKWKNLKRNFLETEPVNKQSGNERKDIAFHEEMSDLLFDKAIVKPLCVLSCGFKKRKSEHNEVQGTSSDGDEMDTGESDVPTRHIKGKAPKKEAKP